MAISLPWQPLKPYKTPQNFHFYPSKKLLPIKQVTYIHAFRRSDFDGFARRVKSGEVLRDVWKNTNDGFEQFIYETKKTAERIDRKYDVSRRLYDVVQSLGDGARQIDRDLEITRKWTIFTSDFRSNWPRYRKQLNDFMDTPLGRSATTIFFLWFALSGWLFRFLIIATWVLPFAGPLLLGVVANNLVIKGQCPACRRQFIGNKNSTVRCANCGNVVWQPKGDFFSRGSRGTNPSKSEPDIIDVEFEEK